mmetsp:Transcript_12805/g.44843  ORF Transcript_12805/g.44843 Transcript_12805/m.44843 type:complete len:211 (-) Transcript_12805:1218-1850(-)
MRTSSSITRDGTSGRQLATHSCIWPSVKAPARRRRFIGRPSMSPCSRWCSDSGLICSRTICAVLGAILAITIACSSPNWPSTVRSVMVRRFIDSWQRYVASSALPLSRSGGVRLTIASFVSTSSRSTGTCDCSATTSIGIGISRLSLYAASSASSVNASFTLNCCSTGMNSSATLAYFSRSFSTLRRSSSSSLRMTRMRPSRCTVFLLRP